MRRLRSRGDLSADLPSMRCVGYRQAWQALEAGLEGQALRHTLRETGVAATRQLAKRQLTWLRSMPHRHVLMPKTRPRPTTSWTWWPRWPAEARRAEGGGPGQALRARLGLS